ncbi:MAG: DUF4389 domain-containing protein [Vicinamibacterales bacterium]
MAYPVQLTVEPAIADRNRLTTAFRVLLAIPHLILVGGVGIGVATQREDGQSSLAGESGLLGAVAIALAVVSWFTLVFAGTHFPGIRRLTALYLRWRARALAYLMLLQDAYPPFGDGWYPAQLALVDPEGPRNRVSVAFRIFMVIPHYLVLFFLVFAWSLATIVAWFAILFTGRYPQAFYQFGVGVLRWRLRVEAYTLLMVDEYPPFSLD